MKTLVLALPGAEDLGQALATRLGCDASAIEVHRFPDGEQRVRLRTSVAGCRVLLAAQLHRPGEQTLPVVFAADAARELGAAEVGLVAPYLPYMRQDARFRPGEAVAARSYARLLSTTVDFLVTVAPHLHRVPALQEIYAIPTRVVSPARAIAAWLARELPHCVLVGSEASTWIGELAAAAAVPFVLLQGGAGDGARSSLAPSGNQEGRTPVIVQDIASTGHSLVAASEAVRGAGWGTALALAVHLLLEEEEVQALHHAGVPRIVGCNTVAHPCAVIRVDADVADAVAAMVA